jgi:siroheme synthase
MPLAGLAALAEALSAVLPADRPAAVIAGATTRDQQVVRAPIALIAEAAAAVQVVAPALLVVGAVVDALPRRRLAELLRSVAGKTAIPEPTAPE